MVREERRQLVTAAIARMDEADREVLGLRYVDQLAFDEIAAVLGVGLSAANMRRSRETGWEATRGCAQVEELTPSRCFSLPWRS